MKIFSNEQIYEGDRLTAQKQGISSTELMERAGIQIFNWLHLRMQGAQVPIHVFCGIGNNGGDGLVISQALKKLNQNVILYCLEFITYKGDAKKAYKKNNLIKNNYKNLSYFKKCIIIDCLFGIGLNRKVKGMYQNIIKKIIQIFFSINQNPEFLSMIFFCHLLPL